MMKGLMFAVVGILTGSAGSSLQSVESISPIVGIEGFNKRGDFVSTIRRADIVSTRGFQFQVTYFESDFKKYKRTPFVSVFKVFVKNSVEKVGAKIQIAMCSSSEVCVHEHRDGIYSKELFRTEILFREGTLNFIVPSELMPGNTEMPRNGMLVWANMPIDKSQWRDSLNNSRNAVEIPSWSDKRFPPRYIKYRNFFEVI